MGSERADDICIPPAAIGSKQEERKRLVSSSRIDTETLIHRRPNADEEEIVPQPKVRFPAGSSSEEFLVTRHSFGGAALPTTSRAQGRCDLNLACSMSLGYLLLVLAVDDETPLLKLRLAKR